MFFFPVLPVKRLKLNLPGRLGSTTSCCSLITVADEPWFNFALMSIIYGVAPLIAFVFLRINLFLIS